MKDKERANAYGVLVRAGALTPQAADEDQFRTDLGLPSAGEAVASTWKSEGGVRRPITLATTEDLEPRETPDGEGADDAPVPRNKV